MKKIIFFLSLVSLALLVPSQNTDAQSKTQDSDDDLLRKSEQISFVVGGFTVTIDFCSNTPQDCLAGVEIIG